MVTDERTKERAKEDGQLKKAFPELSILRQGREEEEEQKRRAKGERTEAVPSWRLVIATTNVGSTEVDSMRGEEEIFC